MEGRYRTISDGINSVDESLFGNSGRNSRGSNKSNQHKERKTVTGPLAPQSVVITQRELERIKGEAQIKTAMDLEEEKRYFEQQKQEKEKIARDRKLKMRELEKRALKLTKKSDEEIAQQAREDAIRNHAAIIRDNDSDVIKLLSSMATRAAAFSVRDKQLEEKKQREHVEEEYERRMDILMEVDRLKEIQRREQEEQEKIFKRVSDRQTITDQIRERERQKLMMLEAKEQENIAMKLTMKRYEDEDNIKAARRQVEVHKSRIEVAKANAAAIERKQLAVLAGKKEIEDMLLYQAAKDAELMKREEEERALDQLKKERQKKLLDESERSQSNAGKADEIRARRAAEERERRMREKERDDAIKKKKEITELVRARKEQALDKIHRAEQWKHLQDDEHKNALLYSKNMAEREEREENEKRAKVDRYRVMLMDQIQSDEMLRHSLRQESQSAEYHQQMVREEARLCALRDKMIAELEHKGVNSRYLSEMKGLDIGKILRR